MDRDCRLTRRGFKFTLQVVRSSTSLTLPGLCWRPNGSGSLRAGFSFERASFWGFFGFDAPPKPIFLRFWDRRVGLGSRMVLFSGEFLRCLQLAKAKGRRSVCSNEGSLEQTFVSGTSALTTRGPSTTAPVSAPGRWHWPRLLALPQCTINDASYQ